MKKIKSLSLYVIFSIILIIAMSVTVVVLTATTEGNYDTIYTVFCGVFGGEILSCCVMKIFKIKKEE